VMGQDLDEADGKFFIARGVAKDRVISTVDPTARHGHKTSARGYDGHKGHVATDPDSEIITATKVTPANAGDASVAEELIEDLIAEAAYKKATANGATNEDATGDDATNEDATGDDATNEDATGDDATNAVATDDDDDAADAVATDDGPSVEVPAEMYDDIVADTEASAAADAAEDVAADEEAKTTEPTVYGDAAYGTGAFQSRLEGAGILSGCKTQPPVAPGGRYAKDRFGIDLDAGTVTCPNDVVVSIRRNSDGGGTASFAGACSTCPLRAGCTNSPNGRTVSVGPHEAVLARARAAQADPAWKADYRATRPKVERKFGHLMARKHGGRHARVRGTPKIDADFNLLAAAVNLARLGVLGLRSTTAGGWACA